VLGIKKNWSNVAESTQRRGVKGKGDRGIRKKSKNPGGRGGGYVRKKRTKGGEKFGTERWYAYERKFWVWGVFSELRKTTPIAGLASILNRKDGRLQKGGKSEGRERRREIGGHLRKNSNHTVGRRKSPVYYPYQSQDTDDAKGESDDAKEFTTVCDGGLKKGGTESLHCVKTRGKRRRKSRRKDRQTILTNSGGDKKKKGV